MKDPTKLIKSDGYFDKLKGKRVKTVTPPLYTGSTVLFETHEDMLACEFEDYESLSYGTERLPNQRAFEAAMCQLEGGHLTRAFPSGISAITHTILAFVKTGDHVLLVDSVYGPTGRFSGQILSRYGVSTSFFPSDVGANISEYINPNTRLIFLESPGSNTFEIQDIPAITAVAKERGIPTIIDNTWATPLYLKPFDLGVDISIQAVTKYISGHSDVLLGTATSTEKYAATLALYYRLVEVFASSHDCQLGLRGLKTFPVRLKQHAQSAAEVIEGLQGHPLIETIIYPALESHPQHEIWKRDFKGASGLFGFTFHKEYPQPVISKFVNALDLFGIGYSWGGYKSLISVGKPYRNLPFDYEGKTIVRLNIGLEDAGDLLADVLQALEAIKGD